MNIFTTRRLGKVLVWFMTTPDLKLRTWQDKNLTSTLATSISLWTWNRFLVVKTYNDDKFIVTTWLTTQAATLCEEGIGELVPRYKCLENVGSYVEKYIMVCRCFCKKQFLCICTSYQTELTFRTYVYKDKYRFDVTNPNVEGEERVGRYTSETNGGTTPSHTPILRSTSLLSIKNWK